MAKISRFLYPKSIEEAYLLISTLKSEGSLVGGGIETILRRNPEVKELISLQDTGLSYIKEEDGQIIIGATTTVFDVCKNPIALTYLGGILQELSKHTASKILRTIITIGGALARSQPYSDISTLFLALNAKLVIYKGNYHEILLQDYFGSPDKYSIIKEIRLPKFSSPTYASFYKFSRTKTDIALLNSAIKLELQDTVIKNPSVVFGSTPNKALKAKSVEEFLNGKILIDEFIKEVAGFAKFNVEVSSDLRASKEYREELVYASIIEMLTDILKQSRRG